MSTPKYRTTVKHIVFKKGLPTKCELRLTTKLNFLLSYNKVNHFRPNKATFRPVISNISVS